METKLVIVLHMMEIYIRDELFILFNLSINIIYIFPYSTLAILLFLQIQIFKEAISFGHKIQLYSANNPLCAFIYIYIWYFQGLQCVGIAMCTQMLIYDFNILQEFIR